MKKFIAFMIVSVFSFVLGAVVVFAAFNPAGLKLTAAYEEILYSTGLITAVGGGPALDGNGDPIMDSDTLNATRLLAFVTQYQYYNAGALLRDAADVLVSDPALAATLLDEAGQGFMQNP